ncbi:MAG: ATP-binding protein [Burkholderiales bacterium]
MNQRLEGAGPVTGRHVAWILALVVLMLAFVLTFVLVLGGALAPSASSPSAQVLRAAEFAAEDSGGWAPVTLPDTLTLRGLPQGESRARYRVSFDLPEAPTALWALRIDRLSNSHRVLLNGQLLHEHDWPGDASPRPRRLPVQFDVAPSLLRAGRNEIELALRFGSRGAGLSELRVGPEADLLPIYIRDSSLAITQPRLLNVAAAALASFMLLIWWRRRSETAVGLFGLLWLIASVRNYEHYETGSPMPGPVGTWFFFALQCATIALLGLFAIALSQRPWPRFRRLAIAVGTLLPLLGIAAAATHRLEPLRALTYPLLAPFTLIALGILWTAVRHLRGNALLGLFTGMTAVVAAAWHDYAFLEGWTPLTDFFWMPFVMPPALGCFAVALVGRVVTAMNHAEDLTRQLEVRVAERTDELARANAAKARFLAAASHDLRQPVVTIGLLVGLVREQVAALPAVHAMVDRIYAAVGSMEALLNGLMDLSRLEPGTLTARLQPVPLTWIFDAIGLHEQPAAAQKGLRLRFRPTSLVVHSDPVLLDQIVRNLVSNAVRYTERGGVLVTARRRANGRVLLQVWDTGVGIAAAEQSRVFEEFVQLGGTRRDRQRGQGLGLAIVQRGARALGHALSLRSAPGRGSCFSIELPVSTEPLSQGTAASPPPDPLHACDLWLIDDDDDVRSALALRLSHWGARVTALAGMADLRRHLAVCAQGGLALPALVVSDQRLADGSGLDCIALIRAQAGREVPVVVVTGNTAPSELAVLDRAGLPVLHKPFRAAELLALLHAALPTGVPGRVG